MNNKYRTWAMAWERRTQEGYVYVRGYKLDIGPKAKLSRVRARMAIHYFLFTDSGYDA